MEIEHRNIELVIRALDGMALALEQSQRVEIPLVETVVEFLRVYADKLHHGKEEALFFPMLVKQGVPPQGCPIGGLNHEHEKGRALVRTLAEQVSAYDHAQTGAVAPLVETMRGISNLYQNHIWKEDAMVFPMADKVLTEADQKELIGKFADVDRAIGWDEIARLETFAKNLTSSSQATLPGVGPPGSCGCGCKT
jgi:hemerythrin-like domain-containing protein